MRGGGLHHELLFGPADETTLYITSARANLPEDQRAAQPFAGGLFAADVGVSGRGYTPFRSAVPIYRNEAPDAP